METDRERSAQQQQQQQQPAPLALCLSPSVDLFMSCAAHVPGLRSSASWGRFLSSYSPSLESMQGETQLGRSLREFSKSPANRLRTHSVFEIRII